MIIQRSDERGIGDHAWLKTKYSFSFANYHNPDRMGFGALRVLNDDWIDAGYGFDPHPHQDMEIITITLSGSLEHRDTLGNVSRSQAGDVQVMSAGSGVYHSEYSIGVEPLTLLQIWIEPNTLGVSPRYEHKYIPLIEESWIPFVSPLDKLERNSLGIYQDAWISRGIFHKDISIHSFGKNTGLFLLVLSGVVSIQGNQLSERDSIEGDLHNLPITIFDSADILLIETPLDTIDKNIRI